MRIKKLTIIEKDLGTISVHTLITNKRDYLQRIIICDKEIEEWSCTCKFGSWWRWAGYWKEKGTRCKHIKKIESLLKELNYIK